jgi:hypothetical protein
MNDDRVDMCRPSWTLFPTRLPPERWVLNAEGKVSYGLGNRTLRAACNYKARYLHSKGCF